MKLSEAIEEVKAEKPNSFGADHITRYINNVEASVQNFLGIDREEWVKYDWKADGNKELIIPAPYDILYKSFLKAKIDYAMEEYESYENNQAQFEADFDDWKAWAMRSGLVISDAPTAFTNWF